MSDQRVLTTDIIAKESLAMLNNNLGCLKTFHRAYEDEFGKKVHGYESGETISIRRPHDPRPRTGSTMQVKDVIEGKIPMTVNKVYGHDFRFSSTELTLRIEDISERVIEPAMKNLVNKITQDILQDSYVRFNNWIGVTGAKLDSYADFTVMPERMDLQGVPDDNRKSILHVTDTYALLNSQTGLYIEGVNKDAYRKAELGIIADVETYKTQVAPVHTNGTATNTTPLVRGASQNKEYKDVKDAFYQDLSTDGWGNNATITKGTVIQIADCYMVNPRTKQRTDVLQQFVVREDKTAASSGSNETVISIEPPIITSGPHQNCEFTTNMDDNAITIVGSASTSYRQNLAYHKNAICVAFVPMVKPPGAVEVSRQTLDGISCRVIPVYDGVGDNSAWRLDVLAGWTVADPALGVRCSPTG
jgi:hypothetical protein